MDDPVRIPPERHRNRSSARNEVHTRSQRSNLLHWKCVHWAGMAHISSGLSQSWGILGFAAPLLCRGLDQSRFQVRKGKLGSHSKNSCSGDPSHGPPWAVPARLHEQPTFPL